MRTLATLLAAATIAVLSGASGASAQTDKCNAENYSKALHDRMKKDGKTDTDIRELLTNKLKRRILAGRATEVSGCSADQTDKALQKLETTIKQG